MMQCLNTELYVAIFLFQDLSYLLDSKTSLIALLVGVLSQSANHHDFKKARVKTITKNFNLFGKISGPDIKIIKSSRVIVKNYPFSYHDLPDTEFPYIQCVEPLQITSWHHNKSADKVLCWLKSLLN